jgi:ribosomal protein L18
MEFGYITVNIYNKNKMLIPILGRRDAVIRNMTISERIYNKIKEFPGIEVYTIAEDKVRLSNIQSQKQIKVVVDEVQPQEEVVVQHLEAEIKSELVVEGHAEFKAVKEVAVEVAVESEVVVEGHAELTLNQENLDALIEEKLEQLPEDEFEDIVLTEEDFEEIAEHNSIKRYEQSVLEGMTKAQLKDILNVERGFEPGHKYYGGYHDTHVALVQYVLNSQK